MAPSVNDGVDLTLEVPRMLCFFPGMEMEKVCPSLRLKSFLGPAGMCGEGVASFVPASAAFAAALARAISRL